VSHARVQSHPRRRIARFSGRRIFAISVALGLALASGIPTATADPGASHEKVFVCKYVGQPKVDERLQTGSNPIDVSTSSIKPFEGLGRYFADAQGQSYVLAWADKGTPEPPVTDCPAPRGPDPVVTSEDTTSCTTYSIRTITTPFVLKDGEWVPGEPVLGAWVDSTPTAQQLKDAGLECRPEQPAAKVVVTPEHATSCTEYSLRDITVTTAYEWNAESQAWELGTAGEPVVGAWVNSTPTAQQLKDAGLDCTPEQPAQPNPIVTTSSVSDTTCAAFTTTTTTTTTPYVFTDGTWVLGVPVVTTGEPVISTPTAEQLKDAGLDCRPEQPAAKVVVTPAHATSCDEYSVRDVTVTTPYEWNAETAAWELGTAGEPVYGAWVNSTPTAQQLEDAGLDCTPEQPVQPNPIVTTSAVSNTTCTAFTTTTTTTATPYVFADGTWVLGVPAVTTGEPVISTPTAGQITAAGLDCATPVPPVVVPPVTVLRVTATATPKATKPAKASVSVLGVSATANPLPAGASAGEADTSGQAAAGELTGLAALLALGAGFMLRRRRGVV
jgi:hypothetical protein